MIRSLVIALALCVLGDAAPASPLTAADIQVPKNEGWVTDRAGVLTESQKRELSALMESYKQGTKHEIAVLIVPSLNGASLEEFALAVGREWHMGTKETSDAALLLIAKNDHKMRIEVGRGLEGNLTDSISGRIIRDVIAPHFKRNEYFEGIRAGVVAMHEAIGGKYGALPHEPEAITLGLTGCIAPFLIFIIVMMLIFIRVARRGVTGRRRWWAGGPPFFGGWTSGGGGWSGGGSSGGGGFSGFGGGGGFSGGGASGGW